MALFKNAFEKASAELTRLRELRVSLEERERKARSELDQLKAGLAGFDLAAMLDDGSNGAAKSIATTRRGRIRELEDEIETCTGIERPLLEKVQAAMRAVNTARAEEIRKQAGRLQKTLDDHSVKVAQLQSALELLEECPFRPEVKQVASDSGQVGWQYAISLSARLANQITALHAEAVAIEQTAVNVGGGVDASSLEELLGKIDECPDDTIAPLSSEVEAWFAEGLALANAEWNGTGRRRGDPEPMTAELSGFENYRTLSVSLVWLKDGVIDTQHSAVKYSNRFQIPRELAMELGAEYPAVAAD